jgi:AcrR family transcriptional regulator
MEDCTVRQIAKAARVSPACVIVHFRTKTALLEEALRGDIEKAMSDLTASMPRDGSLLEKLMHLAAGFFEVYDTNRNLYRALIRSTIFERAADTPGMAALTAQYVRYLSQLIEEERARSAVKPEVNAAVAAGGIFSLYLGALVMLFRTPEMSVENILTGLASMTEQYLKGIERSRP